MSILSDRNGDLVSFSETLYFLLAGTCQSDKVTAALLANRPRLVKMLLIVIVGSSLVRTGIGMNNPYLWIECYRIDKVPNSGNFSGLFLNNIFKHFSSSRRHLDISWHHLVHFEYLFFEEGQIYLEICNF